MMKKTTRHRLTAPSEPLRSVLLACVIAAIHIGFGLPHIGSFITADEHYWVEERIPQYWSAWSAGKWKKTLINDKPGVSLAIVSGPAIRLYPDSSLPCETEAGRFAFCDPSKTSSLYAAFRIPILFTNAALLVLLFFAIRVVAGTKTAFLAALLGAISPHLLGMSQIVNPDSLLWSFGSAGLFSALAFLKSGKWRYVSAAAFAFTFALLSKYVAIILIFFLPVFFLYFRFREPAFSRVSPQTRLIGLLAMSAIPLILFPLFVPGVLSSTERVTAFLSAGTGNVVLPSAGYLVLLSATAAASLVTVRKRLNAFLSNGIAWVPIAVGITALTLIPILIIGRLTDTGWEIFTKLPFDIKDLTNAVFHIANPLSFSDIAFLEISPLVYSLTLPTLFGAGVSIAASVFGIMRPGRHTRSGLPLVLLSFVAVELLAFAASNVLATPRYVILALPIFAYLAADGLVILFEILERLPAIPGIHPRTVAWAAIALSAALSLIIIVRSAPFYTNFANSLLPDNALTAHSWGYGGYEAAQYLNSLPYADRLTVWSDYYGVCEFFRGTCLTNYHFDRTSVKPDYYVLTRRGKIRYMSRSDDWERESGLTAYRSYDDPNPEWELDILGKSTNFVKIVKPIGK